MRHLVLLGDSIFDNATYVPGEPDVIEQVFQQLPDGDRATLLAVDGDIIESIPRQLETLPEDATHLFISVGGNNALHYASLLDRDMRGFPSMLQAIATMKTEFGEQYTKMLRTVLTYRKPTTLCTIYDQCPLGEPMMSLMMFTILSMLNDCITRQAAQHGLPLIDLRLIFTDINDYAAISPIEPSSIGGQKLADRIIHVLRHHDFSQRRTVCYA